MEVRGARRQSLGLRWLVDAARSRPAKDDHTMIEKLTAEIVAAAANSGGAVAKKEQVRKVAEANRAFAHFRW